MKRTVLTAIFVTLWSVEPALSDVAITAENFPDDIFRSYVANELGADKNHDGYLSDAELAAVDIIRVDGMNIEDLSGIEHFRALEQLYCYNNDLEALDVSKNVGLLWLECDGNQLSKLDVSKNLDIITLECENNNIAELSLAHNDKLTYAKCYGQRLYGLDMVRVNDTYRFDMRQYVSDLDKVMIVTAYDASGDVISGLGFDGASGIVTVTAKPSNIRYAYQIDYVRDANLSMDVTIVGTAYDEASEAEDDASSRCGGCDAGWNVFALALVLLCLPSSRAKVSDGTAQKRIGIV